MMMMIEIASSVVEPLSMDSRKKVVQHGSLTRSVVARGEGDGSLRYVETINGRVVSLGFSVFLPQSSDLFFFAVVAFTSLTLSPAAVAAPSGHVVLPGHGALDSYLC